MPPEPPPLGYRHPDYASAFGELGTPRFLPHSGGWILQRDIPGASRTDAMGLYPVFACERLAALERDILELRHETPSPVSLLFITDPMDGIGALRSSSLFDVCRPFKTHYLTDLEVARQPVASRHHAYYARRAGREMDAEAVSDPLEHLDEWCDLFDQLVARHGLRGFRCFSRGHFARVLSLPGVVMHRSRHNGVTTGAQILLIQDDVAHAHLAAFSDAGYALGASYLLDRFAQEALAGIVRYINWGGGTPSNEGLARYKRGWANVERSSWLLGCILDREAYSRLSGRTAANGEAYFPAYRTGEFS